MLKTMRDSFHHLKWVLLAVVAAFIFGFVFIDMGLGGATGGSADDSAFAARVNGDSISYNEFYRAMKNYEDMYRQMYGQQFTPEMAQAMGLPRQVLDTLVDQRLMLQEAERLELEASPEEVRAKLLEIPIFTQDGKFIGMELYTRYVTGPMGYASTADFEADLARDIVLQKIESALMNSVVVTPGAADAEYRRVSENAKIRYALLPAARLAASINVTPAEVDAFYAKNQGRYAHAEQRQVRYLLADTARLRSQIVPTDAEIRQFYESKKEELKTADAARVLHILVKVDPAATPDVDAAARAKAEGLVKQLRAGADFATLARQNSDDPSSSGNGGDMGFVERGQTVEPFEKAIFSIPANTISDPIRTPEYGYHIVKVTERRPAGYRPFEEVKGQLASQLADQKATDQAREAISRVSAQIRENKPKSVDAFVALANATVSSNDTGFFQKSDPIPGIGSNPTLSQWIFAAKEGDIGEVTGTSRGIIIPYVAGVRAAGVTPLAEIRARVEQDARDAKAREQASSVLAAAMAGAAGIDAVAAKAGVTVAEATVNRQSPVAGFSGDTSALVEAAMASQAGQIKGPITVSDGAVAFQVTELKKVTPEELTQNRAQYLDTVRMQEARSLRRVLIERLRKAAKVDINDAILRANTGQPSV